MSKKTNGKSAKFCGRVTRNLNIKKDSSLAQKREDCHHTKLYYETLGTTTSPLPSRPVPNFMIRDYLLGFVIPFVALMNR